MAADNRYGEHRDFFRLIFELRPNKNSAPTSEVDL
jgi:hypothetical protein